MRWINRRCIFFFFCLILAELGFTQQPNLEFHTFTALDKITNSKSTSIAQDSIGYIWIGTEEGLFRYDGQSVFTYQYDASDPHSVPSNIINKLFVDSHKNLWVSTNEGLCVYNPEYDNFTSIVIQPELKGVASAYITAINEDKHGEIYVACEKFIYKYNPAQRLFSEVIAVKQGIINAFIFDDQNNIWIAATLKGGLNYFDQKTSQLTTYLKDINSKLSPSSNEIRDLAISKDILWIGTDGDGINSYNLQNKTFKQYQFPVRLDNFAINILIDKKSNVWFCTYGGLKLHLPTSDNFYTYFYDDTNPLSIGGSLWDIFEDKESNYWTVYSEGGIKIVKNKNKFQHIDSHPQNLWHTANKNTTSVAVDAEGNLWAGYYLSKVDVFSWKKKTTYQYSNQPNNTRSLGNGSIFAIFRDSKQQMWIGSYLGGLQRFNPGTNDFESYRNNPNDTLTISINDVRSVTEDQKGDLWLAVQGKGVDRFDKETKTFHHYNAKNNLLSNDYAFQVLSDSKGNLWVATSWGLSLLRNGEKIFTNFLFNKDDITTISSNVIFSLCEDQEHNIWVGTADGLNKFNSSNQTFTRFSSGLKNKHIGSILSDRKNNIWVSTNVGISKFDQKTRQFINYDQSDGLLSRDFFDRSCYKDDKNNLYFGGSEGIDYFNPDSLYTEKKQPSLVLTDFRIFNKSVTWKSDSTIIKKHISHAREIVLDYKSNSFTFQYQTINPSNPEAIAYRYRLDGFDPDWIDAESKSEASYTNLNPGKYSFRVKAKYDNDNWSEKETNIDLIIVPAWWMTTWFKILLFIILLIVPLILIYLRILRLRNQRKTLEKIVAERTREIQNKNELLKDLNSTKDKLFSIISHDLRSPFSAILGYQDLLTEHYEEFSEVERKEMFEQLKSTTKQIHSLVENLLNWARIQSNTIQNKPIDFNLKSIMVEKLGLYQKMAESKGIKYEYQMSDKLIAFADVDILDTILRNLITNAIKYTPANGNIQITALQINNQIKVSVIDSGTGIKQKDLENLFIIEKTKSTHGTNGEKGSGLGLVLCKELVEKNQGVISVESQTGKGSIFSFTIPASDQS